MKAGNDSQSTSEVIVASDDVFDVIVIGAGPVGETAARRVVLGGLTAAVSTPAARSSSTDP